MLVDNSMNPPQSDMQDEEEDMALDKHVCVKKIFFDGTSRESAFASLEHDVSRTSSDFF